MYSCVGKCLKVSQYQYRAFQTERSRINRLVRLKKKNKRPLDSAREIPRANKKNNTLAFSMRHESGTHFFLIINNTSLNWTLQVPGNRT